MIAWGRLLALSLGLVAATTIAACSSSSASGIPDSKIVSALEMKSIGGHLAMQGNPFCSVSKLLNDATEVKDVSSNGRVIAARNHTIGVEIIRPFAPSCRNFAERKLSRLARGGGQRKQEKGGGDGS